MMYRRSFLLTTLALSSLSGCTSTYTYFELEPEKYKLEQNKGVLITIPKDGTFKHIDYDGSGMITAKAVRNSFSQYTHVSEIAANCDDDECLPYINADKWAYYVVPAIVHWENRVSYVSGKPDIIKIKLTIWDVEKQTVIGSEMFAGKSRTLFWDFGSPQELLETPISKYVDSLYQ